MKKGNNLSLDQLSDLVKKLSRYRVLLVCLIIALVYGFLVYKIGVLSSAQPSQNDVDTQSKTAKVPKIDPKVLGQLKSLQDNSVSVKSLLNTNRSNPFQEKPTDQ